MDNEIAGLYVRIGADFSELQSGLEETRLLVDSLGADGGILTGLVNQTINDLSRFVAGVRQGLAPLVPALQSGLQAPLQEAFRAVNAVLARETDAMISELYSAASRIHNLALSLNLPSPINATALYEGRAEGGQVTAGTPYVVGEAGPELFVPHTSGSIVPNHALYGGGAGGGVSISGATFHIHGVQDANGLYDQLQQIARQRSNA